MKLIGQLQAATALSQGKEPPVAICIGGCAGPRAGLDAGAKRKEPIIAPARNWTPVV